MTESAAWCTPAVAARMLGVSADQLAAVVAEGHLAPASTDHGPRFDPDLVEALAERRAAERRLQAALTAPPDGAAGADAPARPHGWLVQTLCALYEVPATAFNRLIGGLAEGCDLDEDDRRWRW